MQNGCSNIFEYIGAICKEKLAKVGPYKLYHMKSGQFFKKFGHPYSRAYLIKILFRLQK